MTRQEVAAEYEALPPEEKAEYSSFGDYLGANGWTECDGCDEIVEYDEVNESGFCFKCQEEIDEEEEDEDDE